MKFISLQRGAVALGLLGLLSTSALADNVSITANISGTAPSAIANASIQNALNFLSSDFDSATPFTMTANITWADLGTGSLGGSVTGNSSFQNEGGSLVINPLDRYLFGDKPGVTGPGVAGYSDFTIVLNNNPAIGYEYALDTPSNSANLSLADVVYHESLHSMGAVAYINEDGSTGFGTPTIWSRFITNAAGAPVDSLTAAQRAAAVTGGTGALLFAGPNAKIATGGSSVNLYSPTTYEGGSSGGSHIDYDQPGPPGVLYPGLDAGRYVLPTNLELSMMKDIGWKVKLASVPAPSSVVVLLCGAVPLFGALRKRRK